MDADIVVVAADEVGRLHRVPRSGPPSTGSTPTRRASIFAVVATAGTTNAGVVDELGAAADAAAELGAWFHVDGAYGLAPLWSRRAPAGASPASSAPTASSSTRTSGCSRRSTAAPSSTATRPRPRRPHPARRVPGRAARDDARPWNPSTTPTTSPAGPAACRSGSRSPPTAPTRYADAVEHTLTLARDDGRADRGQPAPRAAGRAGAVVVLFRRPGWTPARLPSLERAGARRRRGLRGADHLGRRDGAAAAAS